MTHKFSHRPRYKFPPAMLLSALMGAFIASHGLADSLPPGGPAQSGSRSQAATPDIAKYVITLPELGEQEKTERGGSVTFIGTATVIIHYAGLTLLTDPNFLHKGDHAQLGYGLKSKRLTNPAIELEDLPPVDLVILSHMQGDHFDQLVQEKLDRNIPVVTTEESAKILKEMGFAALYPLKTWDVLVLNKGSTSVRITAMPGRYGPPVAARLLPEVMGSMLDFKTDDPKLGYKMYISGDTMVYDEIREIPRRHPDVDLALLHLGGTKILSLLTATMDAKEGVKMMEVIVPKRVIAIHYNDYDAFKSSLRDFVKEIEKAGFEERIIHLAHGDMYRFPVK